MNLECFGKEKYSKAHAEHIRNNIYNKSRRNTKLRIYLCGTCHFYHLTSNISRRYLDSVD